jgi:hypothetical protein
LTDIGYGDLIKDTVTVVMSKPTEEFLLAALRKLHLDYVQKMAIHAATFKAFAKERLRAGVSLPAEFFSIYDYKKAVVKKTKKKR